MNWRVYVVVLLAIVLPWSSTPADDSTYIGAERCRTCHNKEYDIWMKSNHAKAQTRLPESKNTELQCLFCHATDARKNLATFQFENVQCESCHGPGKRHLTLALKVVEKTRRVGGFEPPTEATCLGCHSEVRSTSLLPFSFDSAMRSIQHW